MENKKKSTRISGVAKETNDSVDKIMNKVERVSKDERIAYLKEKTEMIKKNAEGYIRKNPEKSILIAAGVGVVIGGIIGAALMRRRN